MKFDDFKYKQENTYEQRCESANNILYDHKNKIPIIVEFDKSSKYTIDKNKYVVPIDMTLGQFLYSIRRRIKLNNDTAIFLYINNVLPPVSELIGVIYEKYKESDNLLYCKLANESTFG